MRYPLAVREQSLATESLAVHRRHRQEPPKAPPCCVHDIYMSQVAFTCLPVAVGLWVGVAPAKYVIPWVRGRNLADVWRNPRQPVNCPADDDLLTRVHAVHANAGEGLPLLFGAVLAAVAAGVPDADIDAARRRRTTSAAAHRSRAADSHPLLPQVALNYIYSRVAYTVVYLASAPNRKWLGPIRTSLFAAGFFGLMKLFFQAAAQRGTKRRA